MPLFMWSQQFSVNNEELDRHHRILINMINRLYDGCLQESDVYDSETIIAEMVSYAAYHFAAEEKYMAATGYKESFNHRQMHLYFIDKARQLQKADKKDGNDVAKDLIEFLGNWLRLHILKEDQKYKLWA